MNNGLYWVYASLNPLSLYYKGQFTGAYIADLIVDEKIIPELKSIQSLRSAMEAQIVNYLRLSTVPVGYLVNFRNIKAEWKRFVYQRE